MRMAARILRGGAGRSVAGGLVAMLFCLGVGASAARAPQASFRDVPRGDWAYKALRQLVDAGIVHYPHDGIWVTKGQKRLYPLMTRFEFAVATQRALANVKAERQRSHGHLTASQKAFERTAERLGREFQPELAVLERP